MISAWPVLEASPFPQKPSLGPSWQSEPFSSSQESHVQFENPDQEAHITSVIPFLVLKLNSWRVGHSDYTGHDGKHERFHTVCSSPCCLNEWLGAEISSGFTGAGEQAAEHLQLPRTKNFRNKSV